MVAGVVGVAVVVILVVSVVGRGSGVVVRGSGETTKQRYGERNPRKWHAHVNRHTHTYTNLNIYTGNINV